MFWDWIINLAALALLLRLTFDHRVRFPNLLRVAIAGAALSGSMMRTLEAAPTLPMVGAWVVAACTAMLVIPSRYFSPIAKNLGPWRFAVFISSLALVAGMLYVHLPVLTYLSSPIEFGITVPFIVQHGGAEAMGILYGATLLYAFVYVARLKNILTVLAAWGAILALTYAFILPFGYPRLSGLVFERVPILLSTLAWREFQDLGLAAVVAMVGAWGLLRIPGRRVSAAMVFIHVAIVLSLGVASQLADEEPTPKGASIRHTEKPFHFSTENPNVLVIFLDRFMGGFVERILEEEPALRQRLDGFTWYPRTVSSGPYTVTGVHALFGGYDYSPDEMNKRNARLLDISVEAYQILPRNFSKAGYRVHFTNPRGLGFTILGDCNYLDLPGVNCQHIAPSVIEGLGRQMNMPAMFHPFPKRRYRELLMLLSTMRASPYFAKQHVYNGPNWQPFMDNSAGTTFREWAQLKSLPDLTLVDDGSSNLSIMWSILPHEPYFLGEDCLPKKNPVKFTPEEIHLRNRVNWLELIHAVAARCTLLLAADYFDWMKARGVYDNTRIAIVSDHGAQSIDDYSTRAIQGGTTDRIYSRGRSLMLLKPEGAHGEVATSEAFVPGPELPRFLCEQIGGCVNPFLDNKTIEAHGRDDPFRFTDAGWRFTEQYRNSFRVREEWELRGKDPYDHKGWVRLR